MRIKKALIILVLNIALGFCIGYSLHHVIHVSRDEAILLPEHPFYLLEDVNEEVLYNTLVHYEFPFPEIITAQAVLESGNFKSRLCLEHNNLFGLYNSSKGKYYYFDSWISSVFAYKDKILYKYKEDKYDSYYSFLVAINYATDPNYISKIKSLADKIKNKYEQTESQSKNSGNS